jgi:CRP-like cAMP-binding protein
MKDTKNTELIENNNNMDTLVLEEEETKAIIQTGLKINYPKGHVIFSAGDKANQIYYIESGYVKIYRLNADGRKVNVGSLRNPGEIMGIAETLYETERTCFAGTMTDAVLYVVTYKDFLKLMTDHHYLSIKVAKLLGTRMREAESIIHELVCWQVPGRLALMLLKIGERCGINTENGTLIKLRLTHEEIANMIGTSRQTVTSLINTFKQEQSITVEGKDIKIVNPNKLANWVV